MHTSQDTNDVNKLYMHLKAVESICSIESATLATNRTNVSTKHPQTLSITIPDPIDRHDGGYAVFDIGGPEEYGNDLFTALVEINHVQASQNSSIPR